jgi:hypothetical protein
MAKPRKFSGILNISLSPESRVLTQLACDELNANPLTPVCMTPSLYARTALNEKLVRDGVFERAKQLLNGGKVDADKR